ncbi:VOC family protein [Paenibacillus donghaensis]|uniref:glyoxalase superfamily protein n=1 Tax=Paenibacillus donghaensis TaxID=414771 RepID=UPI0018834FD7|nr:glyoxalase superfamily protein [Paenibacillus donghaensis]MBE9917787.1 VOC family protein [Paenibacillus donghaensis]
MTAQGIIPIFRIFDEKKAKEFYLDYLGFKLDWEHRFEPDLPLYFQISMHDIQIHLSEHHGDCSPGAAIRIEMKGLEPFHRKLLAKQYNYSRPGLEETPWHARECCVIDPFSNRIVFYENLDQ